MDTLRFIAQGLRKPKEVAAIAPSSKYLAREITKDLTSNESPVVELGPGTGVFTRAILARGIPPQNLHLVEMSPEFCQRLQKEFPITPIHQISAGDLERTGLTEIGMVISGLPVLSMSRDLQEAILRSIFNRLRPGGIYRQFTYGPRPPYPAEMLERFGITWSRGARIWRNIPPATVYSFMRKEDFL